MQRQIASALLLTTLSFSAVARDFGQRNHLRERYRKMDICSEIKKKIDHMEEEYFAFEPQARQIEREISRISSTLQSRKSVLESKKKSQMQAQKELTELNDINSRKGQIKSTQTAKLSEANAKIPAAQEDYNQKKRKVDGYSSWSRVRHRSDYKRAKRARDAAHSILVGLQNQKTTAIDLLRKVRDINSLLPEARKRAQSTNQAFRAEEKKTPSVADISTSLTLKRQDLNNLREDYAQLEDQLARADVKLEKCEMMKANAYVYKSLMDSSDAFANQGCDEQVKRNLINFARHDLQVRGINEAYGLMCGNYNRTYDEGSINEPARSDSEFISERFSTGRYERHMRDANVFKISKPNAREIEVELYNVDIEHYYDKLTILDAQGNVVAELSNPNKTTKLGTTVIRANTDELTFIINSDGATEGEGFSLDGYTVRY